MAKKGESADSVYKVVELVGTRLEVMGGCGEERGGDRCCKPA